MNNLPDECLLCGRRPSHVGLFAPKDQRRAGAPLGKVRMLAYVLCRKCVRKRSTPQRVDEVLMRQLDEVQDQARQAITRN